MKMECWLRRTENGPYFGGFSYAPPMLLATLGGQPRRFTRIGDINDAGLKVGSCRYNSYDYVPCTWQNDSLGSSLGFIDNYVSGNAQSVNNNGEIVGYLSDTLNYGAPRTKATRAFIFDSANGMRFIENSATDESVATSINNSGQVVGVIDGQAFIWNAQNGLQTLDNFIGANTNWTFTAATKINNQGQIIGQGTFNNAERNFFWDGGAVFDLGDIYKYEVYGLNDMGQIVGLSYDDNGNSQAFLWDKTGGFQNVSNLVSENGWVWQKAADINNRGQILVEGYNENLGILRVWILTPAEKEPLIFIPGIAGSTLYEADANGNPIG